MSTVLSNGVIVPDVGSTNWASDLETNWTLLNALIGAVGANVRLDRPNIWTAAQTFSEGIYGDLDGTAAMAVSDANGNEIATTYALKTSVTSLQTAVTDLQTAVSGKAADNAVVHLAGAETITGDKTWTGVNRFQYTVIFKDAAAVSAGGYGVGLGFFDYAGNRYGYIQPHIMSGGTKNIVFGNSASGYLEFASSLIPYANNTVDLGTSSNKWKSLNGINPGALSLPDSTYVDISASLTDLTGATDNTYTPTVNGWLFISVANASGNFIDATSDRGGATVEGTGVTTRLRVYFPVCANRSVSIRVKTSGVFAAKIYPCLGNV